MNILSFLPKPSAPAADDDVAIPAAAEGLPPITITPELLAACQRVHGLRDRRDNAILRRVEELHARLPRNIYQTTHAERRVLADEIAGHAGGVPEIEAELAGAERALIDVVTALVADAGQRAEHDAEFRAQREREAAVEQRRQREAERQRAEERRGRIDFVSRDSARIRPAHGSEVTIHRRELANLGWQPEVGDHVRFDIEELGHTRYARDIVRLMPNSTDPWEED